MQQAPRILALCSLWLLGGCSVLGVGRPVEVPHPVRETLSGLQLEDLMTGSGRAAQQGQLVTIDYVGWLDDGTLFDSTRERGQPAAFRLGEARIRGWNEGILGMRPSGLRRMSIPPELAYGSEGLPGLIPPDATLVFEVELLSITD